jgi:hypothetical protein
MATELRAARRADRAPERAPAVTGAGLGVVLEVLERVLGVQATMQADLHAIRQRLETPHSGRWRAADAALLDAIATHVGVGITFSAAELWRHGERVDDALRAAIGAAGVTDTRALGRRLHRLARLAPGPVHLVSVGRDASGRWWTVVIDRQDSHTGHAGRVPA